MIYAVITFNVKYLATIHYRGYHQWIKFVEIFHRALNPLNYTVYYVQDITNKLNSSIYFKKLEKIIVNIIVTIY